MPRKDRPFFDQGPVEKPSSVPELVGRPAYRHAQPQYVRRVEDQLAARFLDLFEEYQVPEYISSNIRAAVENTVANARSRAPSELFEAMRQYGLNLDDLIGWSRANLGDDHLPFMRKVGEIERDFKQAYLDAYYQKG